MSNAVERSENWDGDEFEKLVAHLSQQLPDVGNYNPGMVSGPSRGDMLVMFGSDDDEAPMALAAFAVSSYPPIEDEQWFQAELKTRWTNYINDRNNGGVS